MSSRAASTSSGPASRLAPVALTRDTAVFFWRSFLRLPRGIFWALRHCYVALANGKSFAAWYAELAIGAFPPIFWTFCFKHARRIPTEWRPKIHTDLLPPAEDFLMSPIGLLVFTALLTPVASVVWRSAGSAPLPSWRGVAAPDSKTQHIPLRSSPSSSSLDSAELASTSKEQISAIIATSLTSNSSTPWPTSLRPAGRHPETESFMKIYALIIFTYPFLLYCMNLLAFTNIQAYKDLMAWATYGALHFASPIVIAWWLWFFAPPGAARIFGWCLGGQNCLGLLTHLLFPNAAPWFYDLYGKKLYPDPPPSYSTPGSAAGLVRVDVILGTKLYASGFKKSPVVFGAFPSLHAATAVISALFVARYSQRKGLAVMTVYVYWMYWSTMYFHHHFAVDLIGGTFYSCLAFLLAVRTGALARLEAHHAEEMTTIGWDRVFLGEGLFGTSLSKSWGSGHWNVQHRGSLPLHSTTTTRPGLSVNGNGNGHAHRPLLEVRLE